MTAKQATTELLAEVRGGRLDAGAVDAVLAAAGQSDGTGASTRSTVTLFAMQHGLLDTLEPFNL